MCFCCVKRKSRFKPAMILQFFERSASIGAIGGSISRRLYREEGQRCALSLPSTLLLFSRMHLAMAALDQGLLLKLVSSLVPMAGLHLDCTYINATIHHALKTRTTLIHRQCWIAPVDCRAIRCRQMGEGRAAIVL